MSYYKVKAVKIKKDNVITYMACNNVTPKIYYKNILNGDDFNDRLFDLFYNLMTGNFQLNENKENHNFIKALDNVYEYLSINKIDNYDSLYEKRWIYYQATLKDLVGDDLEKQRQWSKEHKEEDKAISKDSLYYIYGWYFENFFKKSLQESGVI